MTCHACTKAAKAIDYALDDEAFYHQLAALQTYGDYANLIAELEASELAHHGAYAYHVDTPGGHH